MSEEREGLSLTAAIELAAAKIGGEVKRHSPPQPGYDDVHPVPVVFTVSGASTTVDLPNQLGPATGYWWDVRRIALAGFTAGTVSMYRNNTDGPVLAKWTQVGEWTWSGALWLAPNDRLIFVSDASFTPSAQADGNAIQVRDSWVPAYCL